MVWQCITFQLLLHKKGTFTYCDSNPGDGRNQKMWRCWSQIAIDYMKFCVNPLRLVSVPPPPPALPLAPAPPLLSQAWSLITILVHSYTWYTGVSQNNFLWQKYPAFNFLKKSLQSSFFFAAHTFLQHLLPKMLSLLHHSITQESFPDLSLVAAFSPFLNECQLFMPKDFLEPPCLTLLSVSLVLWKRVKGGNR